MSGWRDRLGNLWRGAAGADTAAAPQPQASVPAPNSPTQAAAAPAPAPRPGPAKKKAAGRGGVVAVTVLGLSGDALERVLDMVERECATTGARPVFVTDSHELEPFRRRKLLVDQVVDAEARLAAAPDLPWRLYRRRQYALMGARWRPQAVVAFGRQPDEDCLAELRGGPAPAPAGSAR